MHTKSDNIEFIMGSQTNHIIKELCESLLQKYQQGLEKSIKASEFVFDSVDLLFYNLQRASLKSNRGSYIDCPNWLKDKKSRNKFKR